MSKRTTTKTKTVSGKATAAKPKTNLSGLDAAEQVLRKAGDPLAAKAIVERMIAGGLWKTAGKTPAATIYSAIIREIKEKGSASRFRKVGKGQFTSA
ncbi:MAG: winged helix-turn-helix domain-containing protein [Planctomycetes bacterium]|nr:winged helix-turn-helix domain-containing protein [Planctomycetota bacterium]